MQMPDRFRAHVRRLTPPRAVRERILAGAARALAIAGVLVAVSVFAVSLASGFSPEAALGALARLGVTLATALGIWLAFLALRRVPPALGAGLALAGVALALPLAGEVPRKVLFAGVVAAGGAIALLGGGLGAIASGYRRRGGLAALAGAGALLAAGVGLLVPGFGPATPSPPIVEGAPSLLPDPSLPGDFAFDQFSYGSGRDRHRSEYAGGAKLETQPVDGSRLVEGWSGLAGAMRTQFWGFDATALPLQGLVWFPHGDGPFPLVLLLHGNHAMEDFSEAGYAYLGELLASRGIIAVSVDENFLNSSHADELGGRGAGLRGETHLRAWLLLEHLRLWRDWNTTPGHPLAGRVDLDHVALLGHSRGGEAVAEAALFNRLPLDPDDARIAFDYGFGIDGVIAIAPTDALHSPRGRETRLRDVSYLAIQGRRDGDARSFVAAAQFSRTDLGGCPTCLKALYWIDAANHGQFNTVWGRSDRELPIGWLLDTSHVMPGPAQRRVVAVLVSAFLEVVLGRDERYRAFLADPALGAGWLGHAALLHRYSDGRSRLLATFEEDDDLTTGSRPGVSIRGVGLARWQEREVALKRGDLDSVAVVLGWRRGDDLPTYWLTRPRDLRLDPNSVIELAVAGADGPPDAQAYARPERFSFSLVAALDDGSERVLAPALEALAPRASQTRKIARFDTLPAFEPVFQELRVPLDALDDGERAHVARIGLRFDGTPAGVILVDDIGVGVQ